MIRRPWTNMTWTYSPLAKKGKKYTHVSLMFLFICLRWMSYIFIIRREPASTTSNHRQQVFFLVQGQKLVKDLVLRRGGLANKHASNWGNWLHICCLSCCQNYISILNSFQINIYMAGSPWILCTDWSEQTLQSQQIALAWRLGSHISGGCYNSCRGPFRVRTNIG